MARYTVVIPGWDGAASIIDASSEVIDREPPCPTLGGPTRRDLADVEEQVHQKTRDLLVSLSGLVREQAVAIVELRARVEAHEKRLAWQGERIASLSADELLEF